MIVRLSCKGQLVIPKAVREALGLRAGAQLSLQCTQDRIILEPLTTSPVDALYGKYADTGLLTDLEDEHQREIRDEETLCA